MRPRINIELDKNDMRIESISNIAYGVLIGFSIIAFFFLPDIIPVHFNFKGEVDNLGSKYVFLFIPLIASILFFVFNLINKRPDWFNYPGKITEENALRNYTLATKMMRILKLELLCVFLTIQLMTYLSVKYIITSLIFWILPIILLVVFATVGYYIYKLSSNK